MAEKLQQVGPLSRMIITGQYKGGTSTSEMIVKYDIIAPAVWNFSPRDKYGSRGPVESAILGTEIPSPTCCSPYWAE
jgi:Ni,Fe-hydrogenase I large subunit